MLDCGYCILGFPWSSSRVVQMEVSIFSVCSFISYLSYIHLHTSIINFLGFVFMSWAILFSVFSRDMEALSMLLLGEENMESTSSVGGVLGW